MTEKKNLEQNELPHADPVPALMPEDSDDDIFASLDRASTQEDKKRLEEIKNTVTENPPARRIEHKKEASFDVRLQEWKDRISQAIRNSASSATSLIGLTAANGQVRRFRDFPFKKKGNAALSSEQWKEVSSVEQDLFRSFEQALLETPEGRVAIEKTMGVHVGAAHDGLPRKMSMKDGVDEFLKQLSEQIPSFAGDDIGKIFSRDTLVHLYQGHMEGRERHSSGDTPQNGSEKSLEDILALVSDGEVFSLKKGETRHYYHRSGDAFLSGKKGTTTATKRVLDRLNDGWELTHASVLPDANTPPATTAPNSAETLLNETKHKKSTFEKSPFGGTTAEEGEEIAATLRRSGSRVSQTKEQKKNMEQATAKHDTQKTADRIMSDAELIRGGAKYVPDGNGGFRLELTPEQIEGIRNEAAPQERYSEEEKSALLASRMLHDAELLSGGAQMINSNGSEPILHPTEEQVVGMHQEMEEEIRVRSPQEQSKKDGSSETLKEQQRENENKENNEVPQSVADVDSLNKDILKVEFDLIHLREAYVKSDYEDAGIWSRLKGMFGVRRQETDTVKTAREQYQAGLQSLQMKKLDLIRAQGLSGEALKKAMATELEFFEMESKVRLYNTWTDVQSEKKGLSEKVLQLGRSYNKLSFWKKVAIGTGLFAVGVAGGALGVAGTAGVSALLLAKRGVASAGMFATLEALLEKNSRNKAEAKVSEKALLDSEVLSDTNESPEAVLASLQEKLQRMNASGDEELAKRVRGRDWRRMGSMLGSLGVIFGVPVALNEYFQSAGAGVAESSATDTPKAGVSVVENKPSGAPRSVLSTSDSAVAAAGEANVDSAVGGTRGVFEVSRGDNTWKLLEKHLSIQSEKFSGMDSAHQTHAINALKNQLKLLTPDQLKAAGFSSGDINQLRVGDTIRLDQFFGQGEIERAVSGAEKISDAAAKSIGMNNAKIAEWAAKNPGRMLTDELIDREILGKGGVSAERVTERVRYGFDIPEPSGEPELLNQEPSSRAVAPELSEVVGYSEAIHRPRVDDWYMQMFRVDNSTPGQDWVFDKDKIVGARLSDVVRDVALLHEGKTSGYITGLNSEQLRNFLDFSSDRNLPTSRDFYRAMVAQGKSDVTIGDYLKHVAPVASQGQRIGLSGLFTTTN